MAFAERMIFDTWPTATFSVFAKEGNLHVLRILRRLRWEVCRRIVEAELPHRLTMPMLVQAERPEELYRVAP